MEGHPLVEHRRVRPDRHDLRVVRLDQEPTDVAPAELVAVALPGGGNLQGRAGACDRAAAPHLGESTLENEADCGSLMMVPRQLGAILVNPSVMVNPPARTRRTGLASPPSPILSPMFTSNRFSLG